jgi:hypothetical protein
MHWPGASLIMWTGGLMALLGFLPLYVYTSLGNKEKRTTTITTAVISVGAMSMLFALVNLNSSQSVRISSANFQNTLNTSIVSVVNTNNELFNHIKGDSLLSTNSILKANEISQVINDIDNELIFAYTKSSFLDLPENEIKRMIDSDAYQMYSAMGELSSIRKKGKGISELLKLVDDYKNIYQEVYGMSVNITINQQNFDYYLNKNNNLFSTRLVVQDLRLLNLQIQQLQTSLLLVARK